MMIRNLILCSFSMITALYASAASAASLTTDKAEKFIISMEEIRARQHEFVETNESFPDTEIKGLAATVSPDGQVILFNTTLERIARHPKEMQRLKDITKRAGFTSPQKWAETGNIVLATYMSLEVRDQDLPRMENIPPEALAMMPEGMKSQLKSGLLMARAIQNVPDEDKAVLRPLKTRLEAALD